jgi:hypothetical protein
MNLQNKENLKELLERFVDSRQARQAAEDIDKGDTILGLYPAPQPSAELIAGIKADVQAALLHRRGRTIRYAVYKAVAVAAIVVVVGAITLSLFKRPPDTGRTTAGISKASSVWASEYTGDDDEVSLLTAEVNQIASELVAVRLDEGLGNGNGAAGDLEMELIETNGDFWKG